MGGIIDERQGAKSPESQRREDKRSRIAKKDGKRAKERKQGRRREER